jgi:hypothetical protein
VVTSRHEQAQSSRLFGERVPARGGPDHLRIDPLCDARIAGPGIAPGVFVPAVRSLAHEPLSSRAGEGARHQLAFGERNILLEVLHALQIADRFVERALRAEPAASPRDVECLRSVRREIRSALLLVKEQLA